MENKLEFYTSRGKMIKLTLISSIIIFIGFYCTNSNILFIEIIGLGNLIIGFLGIFIGLYNLIANKPQLILTYQGIKHTKITKNMIYWNQILKAGIKVEKNQRFLILETKTNMPEDSFKYLYRKTAKTDLKINGIKFNLDQLIIDYSKLNNFLISKSTK